MYKIYTLENSKVEDESEQKDNNYIKKFKYL